MVKKNYQKNNGTRFFKNKVLYISGILAIAMIFLLQKIAYYSAEPDGTKECEPMTSQSLSTSVQVSGLSVTDPYGLLNWLQKGGVIDDASCLNKTQVYGIIKVKTEDELKQVLAFAKERNLKVSMAGVKHSMGGHAFYSNNIVLDMTGFNKITVNDDAKTVIVSSGATWHDIQNVIHPRYAIKAMQSTDIFTVGGSISVNAHGMDHHAGSVGNTIKSMRVMLADGSIQTLSRKQNPQLFNLVVGGYGLFGIILDAELELTDNEVYAFEEEVIPTIDFVEKFNQEISTDDKYALFYGHLSTAPSSFLNEMILFKYKKNTEEHADIGPLIEPGSVKLKRLILNLSKTGSFAKELKWFAEKNLEPRLVACTLNRNQALTEGESCLVSRNEPMHDSVPYLQNNLKKETDILQEYYLPKNNLPEFITSMKNILKDHKANVLNASVRVVHAESNFLSYAQEDMFAVVLYLNQPTTESGNQEMRSLTQSLIDLSIEKGGTFFLPYQLHYTPEQLKAAYPNITDFFAKKKQYDPDERFINTFYETYKSAV